MRILETVAVILALVGAALFATGCQQYADPRRPIHLDVDGVPLPSVLWAIDTWAEAGVTFTLDDAPQTVTVRATELPPELGGYDDGMAVYISTPWPPNVAHELGHAIGLKHLAPSQCGIMSAIPCRPSGSDDFLLTDDDVEELAR